MSPHPHVESFTDHNFEARVIRSELPVIVDFSADWCPACLTFGPVIDKLAADYAGKLRVGTADVERTGEIATRYQIHLLPTLLVFRAGRVVAQIAGSLQRARLDALLAKVM